MSSTKKLTLIAMLSAISTLLAAPFLQFILLPAVDFLKVELTILPILIGVFTLGLGSGFIILTIRTILWLLLFNQGPSTWIGLPMNYLAISVFMVILWLFIRKEVTISKYISGAALGTIAFTAVMFLTNVIYAIPMYATFAGFDIRTMFKGGVNAYLWAGVLPFNLIEGIIFAVAFAIIFALLRKNKVINFYNA
ncbi:ECF transporter S component [Lactovum miscens]|uniref:Riboflavin transporter n=1 Tax=Lactovum miscens TaxID=190387 RepID=A0A841CAM8_9LACT|nr:ECF transporter S component [Lactovum miscens]MBB5888449.1 riboflavin transporter FmnP [Lactovum miscens]